MGTKPTMAVGTTDYTPVPLSAHARASILEILTRIDGLNQELQEQFCEQLAQAIGCYHAQVTLRERQQERKIQATKLQKERDKFLESARHMLEPDALDSVQKSLEPPAPATGEPSDNLLRDKSDPARSFLALDVGKALLLDLRIKPTSTPPGRWRKGNLFHDILVVALHEATGVPHRDVRNLAGHAVRTLKNRPATSFAFVFLTMMQIRDSSGKVKATTTQGLARRVAYEAEMELDDVIQALALLERPDGSIDNRNLTIQLETEDKLIRIDRYYRLFDGDEEVPL